MQENFRNYFNLPVVKSVLFKSFYDKVPEMQKLCLC